MFDVMKAKNWEKVVEALTSNVDVSTIPKITKVCFGYIIFPGASLTRTSFHVIQTRTDEVVLLFERPLEPASELQT
jgi:hypothetical protein